MSKISVLLDIIMFKEDNLWVAYCPSLDLSSYGESKPDAKDAFKDALNIFIEETSARGTLEKILLDLGWTLKKNQSLLINNLKEWA